MKKKLKISESQAQYILRLSEDDGNSTSNSGKFACMGGIVPGNYQCQGPGSFTMGQTYVQAVYNTMPDCLNDPECPQGDDPCDPPQPADGCPQGTVWQGQPICDCVPHLGEPDPCQDNPNEECFWCPPADVPSPACVAVGGNLSWAMTNGYSLYQTSTACAAAEPECGGDPHTGEDLHCQCCDGNAPNSYMVPFGTPGGCTSLNGTQGGLFNCNMAGTPIDCGDDHNDGPCPHGTVTVGATPTDPNEGHCMECFAGTAAGPNNAHNSGMAAITGWNCECCKEDGRGNGDEGCPEVSCVNPLHTMVMISAGPPPECECQCPTPQSCVKPDVWDEDKCMCAKPMRGNQEFAPELYSENKTELSEEIKRIKQLLR